LLQTTSGLLGQAMARPRRTAAAAGRRPPALTRQGGTISLPRPVQRMPPRSTVRVAASRVDTNGPQAWSLVSPRRTAATAARAAWRCRRRRRRRRRCRHHHRRRRHHRCHRHRRLHRHHYLRPGGGAWTRCVDSGAIMSCPLAWTRLTGSTRPVLTVPPTPRKATAPTARSCPATSGLQGTSLAAPRVTAACAECDPGR